MVFDGFLINLGAVHAVRSVFCFFMDLPACKIMQNRATYQLPIKKFENLPPLRCVRTLCKESTCLQSWFIYSAIPADSIYFQ